MQNKFLVSLAAQALRAICAREYYSFKKNMAQPQLAQEQLFQKLIRDLARTEYGRQHQIKVHEDYTSFSEKLPIQTYDSLEPWIQQQIHSGQSIITPHKIAHIEPTSGSSGPVKLIPYTQPLLWSFSNMFRIWAYDQLKYGFQPDTGRIFMSISPSSGDSEFTDEREYLREPLKSLVAPFLVLPPKNMAASDFHKALAMTLLREERLEILSIWSPSYLLVLLEYIEKNRHALADLLPCRKRSRLLSDDIHWEEIWPQLKLISCWDNALAEPLANQIRGLFPNVQVQGKGLLATEAPVTVPLIGAAGHLPLVSEVFLEFEMPDGKIKRLHDLRQGDQAQLIITQRAGLTRYRLNDLVEVRSFHQNTPALAFSGRSNQVCDLAGEKLHERFICQALMPLMSSGYFLLIPHQEAGLGYLLLSDSNWKGLAEEADRALCQAYQYAHARQLGQLTPLQTLYIPNLLSQVQAFYQSEGMKLGNIKDSALIKDPAQGKKLLAFLSDRQHKTLPLPMGKPMLMMGFAEDGQIKPELLQDRDKRFNANTPENRQNPQAIPWERVKGHLH